MCASARAAMCGAAGDRAVVCFHPDLSMPDTERWETLLTVGIDTDACALDYVAGNPHDLARDGACGSDVTYDARRAVGGSGGRAARACRPRDAYASMRSTLPTSSPYDRLPASAIAAI